MVPPSTHSTRCGGSRKAGTTDKNKNDIGLAWFDVIFCCHAPIFAIAGGVLVTLLGEAVAGPLLGMLKIAALDTGHTAFAARTSGKAVEDFLNYAQSYSV